MTLQPVPWKMRLGMVIRMQNEIPIGIKKLLCYVSFQIFKWKRPRTRVSWFRLGFRFAFRWPFRVSTSTEWAVADTQVTQGFYQAHKHTIPGASWGRSILSSCQHICQKRPVHMKRDLYIQMKRDQQKQPTDSFTHTASGASWGRCILSSCQYVCQKRHIHMNRGQQIHMQTDLQKRPTDWLSHTQTQWLFYTHNLRC